MAEDFLSLVGKEGFDDLARAKKEVADLSKMIIDVNGQLVKLYKDLNGNKSAAGYAQGYKQVNDYLKEAADLSVKYATAKEREAKATVAKSKADREAKKELDAYNRSVQQGRKELENLAKQYEKDTKKAAERAAKAEDKKRLLEEAKAARQLRDDMANLDKEMKKAEAEAQKMASAYGRLTIQHRELLKAARDAGAEHGLESEQFKQAAASANLLDQQLKKIDSQLGQHQRNVGNYKDAYNGLGVSIGYIASELPNLSQGFDLFFRSVGNNIGQVYNDIKRLREENARLIAQGQQGIPIWKQVGAAIMSWQTAIYVVTAVVTTYGGKFIDWLSGVSKAAEESEFRLKGLSGTLGDLKDKQESLDSSLTNSEKVMVAKAQAEGKSEEEITAIVKDNLQQRIKAKEEYIKEIKSREDTQLQASLAADNAATNASFVTAKERNKIAREEGKAYLEINKERKREEIELAGLKADLDVKGFQLQEHLRKEDERAREKEQQKKEREQEKERRKYEQHLQKMADLRDAILHTQRSFKEKPDMSDLEEQAAAISGQGTMFSNIFLTAKQKQAAEQGQREALELEYRYADKFSKIELTKYKYKEDKESAITKMQANYAKERYDVERKALEAQIDLLPPNSMERLQLMVHLNNSETQLYRDLNELKTKDDELHAEKRKKIAEKTANTIMSIYNAAADAIGNYRQAQTDKELKSLDREEEALDRRYNYEISKIQASTMAGQDKENAIQQAYVDTESKRKEIEAERVQAAKRQAAFERSLGVTKAFISMFTGIAKEIESKGVAGIATSAAITAFMTGIIGVIGSLAIPEYAEGTDNHPGGLAKVGDGGEHELIRLPGGQSFFSPNTDTVLPLPKGTSVTPMHDLVKMANGDPAKFMQMIPAQYGDSRAIANAVAAGVKSVIKDMPQTKVTFTDKGLQTTVKTGSRTITYYGANNK